MNVYILEVNNASEHAYVAVDTGNCSTALYMLPGDSPTSHPNHVYEGR